MVKSDGTLSAPGTPTALSHPFSASDTQDDADLSLAMVRDATGQFLFVINEGTNPPPASCLNDPLPTSNFDACPSISVFTVSGTSLTLAGGSALHPGNPLQPIVPAKGTATLEQRPDLRDLDRNDRARERERIHSH